MIFPIVAYGDPVLKKRADELASNSPELQTLIDQMFATMYDASGVGLAAPQIGKSIRLFIVDAAPFGDDEDLASQQVKDFKEVFINAEIVEETGEKWSFSEGCLSIPAIREEVARLDTIKIRYRDREWNLHEKTFGGYAARIIQHEYDHIEGILFTDRISPLRKKMIQRKLNDIALGKVDASYRMRFASARKR